MNHSYPDWIWWLAMFVAGIGGYLMGYTHDQYEIDTAYTKGWHEAVIWVREHFEVNI